MSKDYYKILEVDSNASPDEIKKSYRNLSKKYHPDMNNGSDERFKEISNAYETLSDPQKRESYDRYGSDGPQQGGFDFNDIFSSFGFNPFGSQKQYKRGSDVKISVSVTILDILKGVNKKVKYKRNVQCTSCNGKGGSKVESCQSCSGSGMRVTRQQTPMGIFQTQSPCSSCNGQGKRVVDKCQPCNGQGLIVDEDTVSIDIPAGVSGGMTLQMRGKGSSSSDGHFGDLLIYINEESNPLYKRDENNIIYSKKINYIDLLSGIETDVELVDGTKSKISIEKGTKCDKVYRIRGKGLPNINGGPSGDFYVELDIDVPILNDEQIQKIKSVII